MKEKICFTAITCLLFPAFLAAQITGKMSREDYIRSYSEMAVEEMNRSGIPASITLAQGMLESDNGNSRLAVQANNHFGIKCHNDWSGKKVRHDDDQRKECFRKYKSAIESFKDHSDFLMTGSRYAPLFELDPKDYKGWARGLKKAGYATNPEYAERLIKIIEENDLHKYDLMTSPVSETKIKKTRRTDRTGSTREIFERNRIDYIVAKEGDTYESLQKELDLLPFELFRYNNLSSDSVLYGGRELYIQPKRNKAERGKSVHTVREGETLHGISQMYGVKPERILSMNGMSSEKEIALGQKLMLRKKQKGTETKTKKIWIKEEDLPEDDKIQFEFN